MKAFNIHALRCFALYGKVDRWHRALYVVFITIFLLLNKNTYSQDSSGLRISLFTCTPGEELYSSFGHSAFRVVDSAAQTDLVFNYGTFLFDDAFYLNFMKGKLNYFLSVELTSDFIGQYQYEKRGIEEQVLNLSGVQKKVLYEKLKINAREENKYYKYDFFFDNCTTRLRDLLKKQTDSSARFPYVMKPGTSFREAIHHYLDKSEMRWSKLGIDILLGYPCDAVMKREQDEFLPHNLMLALDSSNQRLKLVQSKTVVYKAPAQSSNNSIFTPFLYFLLLAGFIIAIGFVNNGIIRKVHNLFGMLFLFLNGILGVLLIIMWTATDHAMCAWNFNLLWAWPLNFLMAWLYNSSKTGVKKYFGFQAAWLLLLLIAWAFLPQKLNTSLIPLVILQLYYCVRRVL